MVTLGWPCGGWIGCVSKGFRMVRVQMWQLQIHHQKLPQHLGVFTDGPFRDRFDILPDFHPRASDWPDEKHDQLGCGNSKIFEKTPNLGVSWSNLTGFSNGLVQPPTSQLVGNFWCMPVQEVPSTNSPKFPFHHTPPIAPALLTWKSGESFWIEEIPYLDFFFSGSGVYLTKLVPNISHTDQTWFQSPSSWQPQCDSWFTFNRWL